MNDLEINRIRFESLSDNSSSTPSFLTGNFEHNGTKCRLEMEFPSAIVPTFGIPGKPSTYAPFVNIYDFSDIVQIGCLKHSPTAYTFPVSGSVSGPGRFSLQVTDVSNCKTLHSSLVAINDLQGLIDFYTNARTDANPSSTDADVPQSLTTPNSTTLNKWTYTINKHHTVKKFESSNSVSISHGEMKGVSSLNKGLNGVSLIQQLVNGKNTDAAGEISAQAVAMRNAVESVIGAVQTEGFIPSKWAKDLSFVNDLINFVYNGNLPAKTRYTIEQNVAYQDLVKHVGSQIFDNWKSFKNGTYAIPTTEGLKIEFKNGLDQQIPGFPRDRTIGEVNKWIMSVIEKINALNEAIIKQPPPEAVITEGNR